MQNLIGSATKDAVADLGFKVVGGDKGSAVISEMKASCYRLRQVISDLLYISRDMS
jgi:hypothetical protein